MSGREVIVCIPTNGISTVSRPILQILVNSRTVISPMWMKIVFLTMIFLSQVFPASRFQLQEYQRNKVSEEQPDLKIRRRERSFLISVGFSKQRGLRHSCSKMSKI